MRENKFDKALEEIRLSPIVSISEEVRTKSPEFYERTGKKIIPFQRGEIDYPTPEYIRKAAIKALDEGKTKYPRSGGEKILKEAILNKLSWYNGAEGLTEENIVVTYGGQEALELCFKLFQGKKAAGFSPVWSCVIENFVPYSQVEFTEVALNHDFSIDYGLLEKTLKEVDLFYLNTPQNPTGKLFTGEEVTKVAELCRKHDVYLISDEAYEMIVFDGKKHFSPSSLDHDNILSAFTFSKSFAMTGWRLGYIVTRDKRLANILRLGNYTQTAGVTTFIQYAGAEALNNRDELEKAVNGMVAEFQNRRDALYEGLKSIEGIDLTKPGGAFYLFPDFSGLIPSGVDESEAKYYVYRKLLEGGVASVYGESFGGYFTKNVRFSFSGVNITQIKEGVERITGLFF